MTALLIEPLMPPWFGWAAMGLLFALIIGAAVSFWLEK